MGLGPEPQQVHVAGREVTAGLDSLEANVNGTDASKAGMPGAIGGPGAVGAVASGTKHAAGAVASHTGTVVSGTISGTINGTRRALGAVGRGIVSVGGGAAAATRGATRLVGGVARGTNHAATGLATGLGLGLTGGVNPGRTHSLLLQLVHIISIISILLARPLGRLYIILFSKVVCDDNLLIK